MQEGRSNQSSWNSKTGKKSLFAQEEDDDEKSEDADEQQSTKANDDTDGHFGLFSESSKLF